MPTLTASTATRRMSTSNLHVRRGREITSPDRTARKRGERLTDAKPGLIVDPPPPGAEVITHEYGGAVVAWEVFREHELQAGRDYFSSPEWDALATEMERQHYNPNGLENYVMQLDALVARECQRQSGFALNYKGLKELPHADKVRSYRMATSRRNG